MGEMMVQQVALSWILDVAGVLSFLLAACQSRAPTAFVGVSRGGWASQAKQIQASAILSGADQGRKRRGQQHRAGASNEDRH